MSKNIAILGGGAWGTALAQMASGLEATVKLYVRDSEIAREINHNHTNNRYLPAVVLSDKITATTNPQAALTRVAFILAAIPAQSLRQALINLSDFIPPSCVLILCAKGIEQGSGLFMSQMVKSLLPNQPVAVLSGPSFAIDVAQALPTAVTIAAEISNLAQELAHIFSSAQFRCYASDDLIGVEVGGACKNVLALAAGAAQGRGLGSNAQAALVTRGFAELRRIGQALGAKPQTMGGLAVLGDLLLSCASPKSRNYAYGQALGRGESLANLPLAEGVTTAPMAAKLCHDLKIEAPIIDTVAALLNQRIDIDVAVKNLINRPLKFED